MDLRAKITDAVYDHPRADDQINAVMGVVEAEIEHQRAAFLQAVADHPGIPDYAHEGLMRELGGEQ